MDSNKLPFAHTAPGDAPWEPLADHLAEVAALTADHAAAFDAADWGRALGAWHDLGKYSEAFQDYLRASHDADAGEETESAGRVDHSTYGARHAYETARPPVGPLLAFCIAGHHAGLADATTGGDEAGRRSTLAHRLDADKCVIPPVTLPPGVVAAPPLKVPVSGRDMEDVGFSLAFFTRMLFSALIDADRTATEGFCDPRRGPTAAAADARQLA